VTDDAAITFSFGENWQDFSTQITKSEIEDAISDIRDWLGKEGARGRSCVDVGSGSGLSSLALTHLGASRVHSFDYDPASVSATHEMRERYTTLAGADAASTWRVEYGSVLDSEYITSLGTFDIVYSWGVLHHTGQMWRACENAVSLLAPQGTFLLSLYTKTTPERYERDLALKRRFNEASEIGKQWMICRRILRLMWKRARRGENPFTWRHTTVRGMNTYHDIVDWLGGLPYEVANRDEVEEFGRKHGLTLVRSFARGGGGCSVYLLQR
jgi:2-polyprenyl-6-hydroxyphenyl methylase/3-demethylubiquinone-9 3-methyltransferase